MRAHGGAAKKARFNVADRQETPISWFEVRIWKSCLCAWLWPHAAGAHRSVLLLAVGHTGLTALAARAEPPWMLWHHMDS